VETYVIIIDVSDRRHPDGINSATRVLTPSRSFTTVSSIKPQM